MSEELKMIFKYLLDFAKHPEEYNDDMVALLKVEQVELLLDYVDNIIGQLQQKQNITNELEKWLEDMSNRTTLHISTITGFTMCLNKLQELKGSDSNVKD